MKISRNKRKRAKRITCVLIVCIMMLSFTNIPFLRQTKAEEVKTKETYEWLHLYQTAKYRVCEVNHVVYCYFTEDYSGYGWLIDAFGLSSQTANDKKPLLPCENRENLRIAGTRTEAEEYHAGELVAVGLNLETVKNQEEIRIADSLLYEGESIPVTKVELEQFVYAFSTDTYQYPSFHILSDSISLHIGKNVTDIRFGDAVSVIHAYTVGEGNAEFCAADSVLYRMDEEGHAGLLNIPDRYAGSTMALPDTCDAVEEAALENLYKYDALYPFEYSMGYLASEYLKKNYIRQRTFYWDPSITLEEYLTRNGSLYIPIEIEDPEYDHASVLVLYGDGQNHKMYDEITSNEDIFIENAFYRKGYKPSHISVDRMSYMDLTSYETMEQYDFIFIEDDTYDYFGETQYQIIHDASANKVYITYAKNLEELPYADLEQNIIYKSVEEILLPDCLEPDGASVLLMHQKELFPKLTSMRGAGDGAFYRMNEEGVIYAEDDETVYYVGVMENNTNKVFHLDTEKTMHVMPCAFQNAEQVDIYVHAPMLYLWHDCFVDYSLAEDDVESRQEIHVSYDASVYQSYEYESEQAEFPAVGTEDEIYEYWAVYELVEADSTEEASTEVPSTESAGGGDMEEPSTETAGDTGEDENVPVRAVEAIPLSGESLSMKPRYYLNNSNIGSIIRYSKKGKQLSTVTLHKTNFSTVDECNADYLIKKITTLKKKSGKLFLLAADSRYDEEKAKKYNYQVIVTGMDLDTLSRAINLMNCKYFQYLGLVQSYNNGKEDIYIHEEKDLYVFHHWDKEERRYQQRNIRFNLSAYDWQVKANEGVFIEAAYGIELEKFIEYYEICDEINQKIDKIIDRYRMKVAKTEEELLNKINDYVRNRMSYDEYYEIAGLSWGLKKTDSIRNRNQDPKYSNRKYHVTDCHGMCGAYSRVAFAIAAKCGVDAIPCAVYKDAKSVWKGATHSITKVTIDGVDQYCDFCWSSGGWDDDDQQKYMFMTKDEMLQYEDHYRPIPDNMGTKITINAVKKSSEVKITFDGNGGRINFSEIMTQGGGKIMDFPDALRKGYVLKGWYTKKNGGNKVNIGQSFSEAKKLYAHWEKVSVKKGKIIQGEFTQRRNYDIVYEKQVNVDGYQLQYGTSKSFTGSQTKSVFIKGNQKDHYVFYNLSVGRNYYFRVRAYRQDSTGTRIYGKWSIVKKVKVE